MCSIIIKKAITPVSLVMWISSQVNELDENLRVLSNHGKMYFICLLFFPLTESERKVFKQVKKNKLCLYTFLSSHPTNYCRYSKVLLTNHVLKIHPHLNVCVCVCHLNRHFQIFIFCNLCAGDSVATYPWVAKITWRKKWQSIPVFLPGPPQGQTSLLNYSPWGHSELDTTG